MCATHCNNNGSIIFIVLLFVMVITRLNWKVADSQEILLSFGDL